LIAASVALRMPPGRRGKKEKGKRRQDDIRQLPGPLPQIESCRRLERLAEPEEEEGKRKGEGAQSATSSAGPLQPA